MNKAKKDVSGNFLYKAKPYTSDGWSSSGNEWVYFRGRNSSGTTQATELDYRNYRGSEVSKLLPFINGYGAIGTYYRMAIEYSNSNPYQWVYLTVNWIP